MDELKRESEPPRASFLGLPVELRLHIYSYVPGRIDLFNLHWNKRAEIICGHLYNGRVLGYGAGSSADLRILAVSKQIFAEAMPVIYRTVEIIPWIDRIPEYALTHVTKLVVLCDYQDEQWYSLPKMPGMYSPATPTHLWLTLSTRLPRVKQVRLHLYLTHDMDDYEKSASEVLQDVYGFASLDTVIVGTHDAPQPSVAKEARPGLKNAKTPLKLFKEACITQLQHQASQVGRSVTTIEEKLDESTCLVCTKGFKE